LFERFKLFNRCAQFKSFTGNRTFNPASEMVQMEHYFIDYYRDPQISQLAIDDLRQSRLYLVDPAPIPADEPQRTYDWMKSWDFLETSPCATNLVNLSA
jgi:hypothetical protein